MWSWLGSRARSGSDKVTDVSQRLALPVTGGDTPPGFMRSRRTAIAFRSHEWQHPLRVGLPRVARSRLERQALLRETIAAAFPRPLRLTSAAPGADVFAMSEGVEGIP
jgi:hypothetical protein